MIGALIALISLNLSNSLVANGQVAGTFTVTGATTTTPIALTCTNHGVPLGRVVHGVVSGVGGTTEANGLWVLTPTDPNTFTLSTYTAQGLAVQSVGSHTYTSGGHVQYAFPDYCILLGRRNIALNTAAASPRIVFVPTDGRKWDFEPYGGVGAPAALPPVRGSLEQQSATTQPQLGTSFTTYEVYVNGAANPPSPDFGDFDATQVIVDALFATMFDTIGPARAQMLHESWPSQVLAQGTQTQRGQQWRGILELQHSIQTNPLQFVPNGTSLVLTVTPDGGGSADSTIIDIQGA